jgi:hypothetical protein
MLETILILTTASVLSLAVLAFLCLRHLAVLRLSLPDRALVEQLSSSQVALTASIEAQRKITQDLPRTVSSTIASEVRGGLVPFQKASEALSGELARSHDGFTRAVLTLNHDGSLSEWVGGFREAMQPLVTVSTAVEHHYETAGQILRTTGELVEQWAAQKEAVVSAFDKFREAVDVSAAHEVRHLRDLEQRVMERLEEVAETNANVASGLSELQVSGRNALETNADLARAVERTAQQVGEVVEIGRQTQSQHHELIRAQQQAQKDAAEWQKQAEQGLTRLQTGIGQISAGTNAALEALRKETQATLTALEGQLAGFHRQHAKAVQDLSARQEAVAKVQEALAEREQELLGEASLLLRSLPTRRNQVATLALFGAQLALMLLVVWRAFQ